MHRSMLILYHPLPSWRSAAHSCSPPVHNDCVMRLASNNKRHNQSESHPPLSPQAPVQKHLQRRDPNASSVFGGPEPSNNNNIQERAPAGSRARKNEFVDNRIGAGVMASNENQNYQQRQPEQQRTGFGDTGASSVKVHHAPGGRSSGNIIGGWN